MADLPDYYTQAQISEAEAAGIKGGLDANKSATPVSRNIYLATDTHILYVCFVDGAWTGFDASILTQGILTLYANMVAGGYRITGLGAPTTQNDALRYGQAEIRNADIAAAAAIAYSKLNLALGITNADIAAAAAIAFSKLEATPALDSVVIKKDGSVAFTGDQSLGTKKLTNVGDPTNPQDAATRAYALSLIQDWLLKAGGTMSGAIAMGANKITGLAAGTVAGDAARYDELNTHTALTTAHGAVSAATASKMVVRDASARAKFAAAAAAGDALIYEQLISLYLLLAGGTMSGAIAMGANKITGLAAATANGDAVRFEQMPRMASGSYTANDANDRQITVGFLCKQVIVHNRTTAATWICLYSTSCCQLVNATAVIVSADVLLHATDGFIVDRSNANEVPYVYDYVAFGG